jgi:hypothetical protein
MNRSHVTAEKAKQLSPKTTPARVRKRLEAKLFPLGGSKVVCLGNDPHTALIAEQGELFSQQVQMRPGQPHDGHSNAAALWAGNIVEYQLVTGYALSGDHWYAHSWVIEGNTLYETTHQFDRYFGVVLPLIRAHKFWMENFYIPSFPNEPPPPTFWEKYPLLHSLCWILPTSPAKRSFVCCPSLCKADRSHKPQYRGSRNRVRTTTRTPAFTR